MRLSALAGHSGVNREPVKSRPGAFFAVGERAELEGEQDSQLFPPEQLTRM
jgi:hypothetical protein